MIHPTSRLIQLRKVTVCIDYTSLSNELQCCGPYESPHKLFTNIDKLWTFVLELTNNMELLVFARVNREILSPQPKAGSLED